MAIMNTTQSFGSVAKFFHWVIALLIICLLFVGFFMDDITQLALKFQVYNLHKLFGLTVLSLAVLRLLWRWSNPVPELPAMPQWEVALEKTVKVCLYMAIFLMPLSGWIMATAAGHPPHLGNVNLSAPFITENEKVATLFATAHEYIAWIIISLLCLHVAGGFKHHFINKDNILKRMMPGGK